MNFTQHNKQCCSKNAVKNMAIKAIKMLSIFFEIFKKSKVTRNVSKKFLSFQKFAIGLKCELKFTTETKS
jgi:hypothetical protein